MIYDLLYVLFCGLLSGLLIGSIGLGGVLLVPMLMIQGRYDIHQIMHAASFSYLFTGLSGSQYHLKRSESIRGIWYLVSTAFIGAILGAYFNIRLNRSYLIGFLSLILFLVGINGLNFFNMNRIGKNPNQFAMILLGLATGVVSALTGTGGPLFLIPAMMLLSYELRKYFGLVQVIQIPIAIAVTLYYSLNNSLDLRLGIVIAIGGIIGVGFGSKLSTKLPASKLRMLISYACILCATILIIKLLPI